MNGPASGERIVAHLAFARAVAARSLDPRCRAADREDLIAWGVVDLVQAGRKLRPRRPLEGGRGGYPSSGCYTGVKRSAQHADTARPVYGRRPPQTPRFSIATNGA